MLMVHPHANKSTTVVLPAAILERVSARQKFGCYPNHRMGHEQSYVPSSVDHA